MQQDANTPLPDLSHLKHNYANEEVKARQEAGMPPFDFITKAIEEFDMKYSKARLDGVKKNDRIFSRDNSIKRFISSTLTSQREAVLKEVEEKLEKAKMNFETQDFIQALDDIISDLKRMR